MGNLWTQLTSMFGLDPDLSYKDYDRTIRKVEVRQDPDTGEALVGIGPSQWPNRFSRVVPHPSAGFQASSVEQAMPADWTGYYWDPPPETEASYNWYKSFLYGEALVAGTLILGPTILDIAAALVGGGKKTKTHDPQKFSDGLHRAAQTFQNSTEKAMPVIMSGLSHPAVMIPFVYLNLEALHKQELIDSAVAHTIEPLLIGTEFMKALGQSGIIGQLGKILPG